MTASIPRETVAQFIVDQVEQPTLASRTTMITAT